MTNTLENKVNVTTMLELFYIVILIKMSINKIHKILSLMFIRIYIFVLFLIT